MAPRLLSTRPELALFGGPPVMSPPAWAVSPEAPHLAGEGPIAELEARFREWLGVEHALALSSGTAALHVALRACGVRPGDEVIVPAYDVGAAVAAVRACGARPVFADIRPERCTLDPEAAAQRITPRTRALIVTHLFGMPADLEPLLALARAHRLSLIEDAAQALGATYRGRPVGTWGDFGCFSLGPGKILNAGEGGILVTRDLDRFRRAVRLSQHPLRQLREGIRPSLFALNYRMHPTAAETAQSAWETMASVLAARRAVARAVNAVLAAHPGLRPIPVPEDREPTFWIFSPAWEEDVWEGVPRWAGVMALAAEGIPIAVGPIGRPLHRRMGRWGARFPCPMAEARCRVEVVLALPPEPEPGFLTGLEEALERVYRARWAVRAWAARRLLPLPSRGMGGSP
jgi:dTDP-4-amino-4,6-dideoxygalactose transaminase